MERATIESLINVGMTQREIGRELGIGQTSVRHWLDKYGLETRTVANRIAVGSILTCSVCGKTYQYDHKKGHGYTRCNSCHANARVKKNKLRAVEYMGGKCQRCGYNKCVSALHFHHIDPASKDFSVSGKHCLSWKKIKAEIEKCVLLCANCHAEEHSK